MGLTKFPSLPKNFRLSQIRPNPKLSWVLMGDLLANSTVNLPNERYVKILTC